MYRHPCKSPVRLILPAILFVILASSCFFGAAHAADQMLNDLYEKSGMTEGLRSIAPSLLEAFDQSLKEFQPSERPSDLTIKAARDLISSSFAADNLKGTVLAQYEANLTPEDIRAVLAWLDSPLGSKATRLEIESSTPEAEPQIQDYIAAIDKNPPPEARANLIVEYERATGLTQATTSIIMGMQLATATAFNALLAPPEKQKSASEISETIEKDRTMLEGALRPDLISRLLYTYRSLSDTELKQLVDFESSELGKKFTRTALAATYKALVDATASFSKNFQIMKEPKRKPSA